MAFDFFTKTLTTELFLQALNHFIFDLLNYNSSNKKQLKQNDKSNHNRYRCFIYN